MNIPWDDAAVVAIMGTAVLLNVACHNDPAIKESLVKTAGRRLLITAQSILLFRLIQVLYEFGGSGMSKPILFVMLLWGLGSIMSSIDHITRRWGREVSDLLKPSTRYERRRHQR
jgi:hypothetical protein